jgi:hypothetical protein
MTAPAARPPHFVVIPATADSQEGMLNAAEIKFAYDVPAQDIQHAPPGFMTAAHVHIEFISGGSMNIPNITVKGLASLISGAPF